MNKNIYEEEINNQKYFLFFYERTLDNSIGFNTAATYLSMLLYATKHNLKLGYLIDDITKILNYFGCLIKNGLRL